MRKHAVVLTLTSLEIFALALLAFFWLVMRADLMTTYAISSGGGSSAEGTPQRNQPLFALP